MQVLEGTAFLHKDSLWILKDILVATQAGLCLDAWFSIKGRYHEHSWNLKKPKCLKTNDNFSILSWFIAVVLNQATKQHRQKTGQWAQTRDLVHRPGRNDRIRPLWMWPPICVLLDPLSPDYWYVRHEIVRLRFWAEHKSSVGRSIFRLFFWSLICAEYSSFKAAWYSLAVASTMVSFSKWDT